MWLHLGCGENLLEGAINCDPFAPEADMHVSATNLERVMSGSVDLVEHHHMIEHLTRKEVLEGLAEWKRVLKRDGILVFTCPDLDEIARRWVRASEKERWGGLIDMIYGSQEHEGMFHRSGLNLARGRKVLEESGFRILKSYARLPLRPTPSLLLVARKEEV